MLLVCVQASDEHKVYFRHFYVFTNCGKSFKTNFDTVEKCVCFSVAPLSSCAQPSARPGHFAVVIVSIEKMNENGESEIFRFSRKSWPRARQSVTRQAVCVLALLLRMRSFVFLSFIASFVFGLRMLKTAQAINKLILLA